jgi:DNA-binding CsgD family transcriptional regulator
MSAKRSPNRSKRSPQETPGRPSTALTERERQILHLVCGGQSNKKVGRKLNLSESTVKVHLHHIYQKLAIRNRTALAAGGAAVQGRRAMTHRLVNAARGKHIGERVDKPDEDEAEHFMPCPNCGAPIDMRDLGQVLARDTPLHIEQGRLKKRAATKAAHSAKSARPRR